jgi:precorrin-6B methylase 2
MVSATVLLLEVSLTRVFSMFLNHHYAFVVMAVALLGLSLGATLYATIRQWWFWHTYQQPSRVCWQVCWVYGVTLIVVTVMLTQTSLASVLPIAAGLALLPFLVAGLFLALVFTMRAAHSRELYAADLLGAGVGCVASLPALQWLGAVNTLALVALSILGLAALLVLATDQRRWPVPVLSCLVLGGVLGLKVASGTLTSMPMAFWHSNKHLGHLLRNHSGARIVDTRWSVLARTDVVEFPFQGQRQYAVFTDGGAATSLVPLPATPDEWARLDHDVGLFPYRTPPRERVLALGAGGGIDVVLALHGGAQNVTAVEVNPDVLRAVERFIPPERNAYRAPAVQVVRGEGRHFVRRTSQLYDLIVLSQVYTGAAQRQGVAMVENYVLTVEAFQDYLAHLTPQGRLVVQVHDVEEVLRAMFMGLAALARRGIPAPETLQHLLILHAAPDSLEAPTPLHPPLMILRNTPYTLTESRQQVSIAQAMQFAPLFVPHVALASPLEVLIQSAMALTTQPAALPLTLQPATDNRPFFYATDADLTGLSWLLLGALLPLLGLHLWHYARQRDDTATATASTAWLPFFAATGYAALSVQVALLQRYVLVLGSPTLTLVVLLFPLLFFGGLGSLGGTVLDDRTLRRLLPWSCMAIGVLLLLSLATFPRLLFLLEKQALFGRAVSTAALLAPLGALMGLPFPVALRLLSPMAETITPWAWGVNAVASVLGAVAAVVIAMTWGLQAVLLLGALVYLGAGCWVRCLLVKEPISMGT